MTTLHHLDLALLDVRERLTKELQFSTDAERQICQALDTVSEALDHLTATIKNAYGERHRALAMTLGTPGPQPETINHDEHHDTVKLPQRKMKIASGGAAE